MISARLAPARPAGSRRLRGAAPSLPPHPPRHRRHRCRPCQSPAALFGVDTDGTGGAATALMVAGIAGALALSAAPLLTGASARRNAAAEADRAARAAAGDPLAPLEEEEAEAGDVKWGAASVIACIPVINWLAWVFAALTEEDRAPVYWLFAALYAAPALHGGLMGGVDGLALAATAACAAHVQLERAARTSPTAALPLPRVEGLGDAARKAGSAAAGAAGAAAGAAAAVGKAAREGLEGGGAGDGGRGGGDDPFGFDPADAAAGRAALPPDMRRRVSELEAELAASAKVDADLLAAFDERLKEAEREE